MSTKYKSGDEVPLDALINRLEELSDQITKGNLSQFCMRVPAEVDYCPDLVMSTAATRLKELEKRPSSYYQALRAVTHFQGEYMEQDVAKLWERAVGKAKGELSIKEDKQQ